MNGLKSMSESMCGHFLANRMYVQAYMKKCGVVQSVKRSRHIESNNNCDLCRINGVQLSMILSLVSLSDVTIYSY